MDPSGIWQWSNHYQAYYRISPTDNCFVLADGTRLDNLPAASASQPSYQLPLQPLTPHHPLTNGVQAPVVASVSSAQQPHASPVEGREVNRPGPIRRLDTSRTRGTQDRRYRKRDRKFFCPGRVFKALYVEHEGDEQAGMTIFTGGTQGQNFVGKTRWFIVVRVGKYSCSCVPIHTYRGRGIRRRGLVVQDHGIVFSGQLRGFVEYPEYAEFLALVTQRLVKVNMEARGLNLDPKSRIDYRKVYNVEFQVPVSNVGVVAPEYLRRFLENFEAVFNSDIPVPHLLEELIPGATWLW